MAHSEPVPSKPATDESQGTAEMITVRMYPEECLLIAAYLEHVEPPSVYSGPEVPRGQRVDLARELQVRAALVIQTLAEEGRPDDAEAGQ